MARNTPEAIARTAARMKAQMKANLQDKAWRYRSGYLLKHEYQRILSGLKAGALHQDLADAYGVNRSTITGIAMKAGLRRRKSVPGFAWRRKGAAAAIAMTSASADGGHS